MKARAMTVLLCLLSALVEVHSQTAPYVIFMGNKISNHGYVDLNRVWTVLGNALRCRTDLYSCCSATQGPDRGDWYFPNGNIVPFFDNVYENHGPQRVSLRYTGSGGPSGIYRCDIETNAVNDNDGRETVYVGLYTSGGDITIPDGMTFSEDSDLNEDSPQFNLTCTSTGGPATTVTWTRDSEMLSGGITVLDDPVTAQYTHTLTVTERLGGLYQCTVANSKPSSVTAQLIVSCSVHGLTCTSIIALYFSQLYYSVIEGKSLTIPVLLNGPLTGDIDVNVTITPVSAGASLSDLTYNETGLMFPPNTTEQNFTIYAVSDAMIETQEEFTLNVTMLKYGSWYMIMTGAMSHLLVEDATVSVGVSSPQYSVLEGGMMAVMVEVLSGNVTEAFEVNVTSVNGTADANDYMSIQQTLTFSSTITSLSLNISIKRDQEVEMLYEYFTISMATSAPFVKLEPSFTVYIVDTTIRLITSPNNASVTPGESTNLTCVFQSSNTLDVNWFKDNVNITNDGRFMTQITRSAAGTYTSMEQFDSTSLHDCGKYYCMAVSQKIACSVFASTAILQVIALNSTSPAVQNVSVGSMVTLFCKIDYCGARPTVEWTVNDPEEFIIYPLPVQTIDQFDTVRNIRSLMSTATINTVGWRNNGTQQWCSGFDAWGERVLEQRFNFIVKGPKIILTLPTSPTISGQSVSLNCSVIVPNTLTYTVVFHWAGPGATPAASPPSITGQVTTSLLTFSAVKASQAGQYTCIASFGDISVTATKNLIVQSVLIQLRLSAVRTCSEWVTDRTELKIADITAEAVKQLSASCQCTQASTAISEETFACFIDSPTHVTYRAKLTGTQAISTASFLSMIETWNSKGPAISVRSVLMRVDTQCMMAISSFSEEECSTPQPPTTSAADPTNITVPSSTVQQKSTVPSINTAAIVGGVVTVVVVLIVAATVLLGIIAVVSLRGRRGRMSFKIPEEHSMNTLRRRVGGIVTSSNVAYERAKNRSGTRGEGGGGGGEGGLEPVVYAVVSPPPSSPPPSAQVDTGGYDVPSVPSPHKYTPLPVQPLASNGGVEGGGPSAQVDTGGYDVPSVPFPYKYTPLPVQPLASNGGVEGGGPSAQVGTGGYDVPSVPSPHVYTSLPVQPLASNGGVEGGGKGEGADEGVYEVLPGD